MRSQYAGIKRGSLHQFGGAAGDVASAQQAVLGKMLFDKWTAEKQNELRKYNAVLGDLMKRADGLNEWIEGKGQIPFEQAQQIEREFNKRARMANDIMKGLVADYRDRMMKAGVTSSLGYNFYDLRGPAYLIYPVNTPLRNELPRWGKVNAGYGTAVHWKYTSLGPSQGSGTLNYAGAAEGKRVGWSLPNENDAIATYAELGVERAVSFTAEFAGEGYTDNVADEHIRGAHQLWLQEESIIIGGNPGNGTGLNGFQLGTANTPSTALSATIPSGAPSDGSTAGFSNTTSVAVYVVELTMLGYPTNSQYGYQSAPVVGATGLVPSYSRTDAGPYSDSDTINGGMGHISANSNVSLAITSTPYVKASVVPKKGAIAWAWFVDDQDATTPTTANALLSVITTVPYVYLGANSKDTALSGNQTANATGLNADKSNELLDFAGILAWTVTSGTWLNMSDISKTDPSTGSTYNGLLQPAEVGTTKVPNVVQIDYDLQQQWNAFQTIGDEMWMDAQTKLYLSRAIAISGNAAYRFQVDRDQQGNVLGGMVVSGYKSVFSMNKTGAEEIPLHIHPMMPAGTILYHKTTNPYSYSRIPGVSGMFVQRDYYGIEWPINKRQWEFGSYVHEVYGNYIPGLLTVRTGIQGVSTT